MSLPDCYARHSVEHLEDLDRAFPEVPDAEGFRAAQGGVGKLERSSFGLFESRFRRFHAGYRLIEGSCRLVRLNQVPFLLGRFEVSWLKSFGDLEELRLPGANLSGELEAGCV